MATILITGGTGLIGRHLSRKLMGKGYKINVLSRRGNRESEIPAYYWNWEKGEIEKEALETADYIIHLAGANIGDKRWTKNRKQLIINSRARTAEFIYEKLKESNHKPKAFISASAIGYYGTSEEDKIFTENDPPGNDFLGITCSKWEKAVDRFNELGIRTVKLRAGVVFTKYGGVLARMTMPVKLGIGSALGTGKQYFSWIHIEDLCGIYIKAIEDIQMTGAYNAVAPDQKTNSEFMRFLAGVLNQPFWFPNVSSKIIRLIFGEMSVTVLNGSRISADKIIDSGYNFRFPELKDALEDL